MKLADKADIADSIRDCRLNNRSKTIKELQYESRVLRLMFTPVKKGGDRDRNLGIVLIVEDITEQKIQERSREEFFSIASHELRTPLTAIRGNTSMMAAYFPEIKDNKELTSMVADIQDSSVRLIEIVNDFLDASRLEQGKMEFSIESFHLSKIADKVCSDVDNVVKEKNLTLKITKAVRDLPHISADINRVTQVLYNMVGNAIKFTEKGGIVIDASVVGRMARITISDTGHGIPTEKQSLLFHKFQQASASLYTRDATRGTGLGLYISMLLIEKMGGKLILDKSEVSKGSEFSFTLPIAISK
jgi:signal transduction histidine kinase